MSYELIVVSSCQRALPVGRWNRGILFPSDNAKLGTKKPMEAEISIGVEFMGVLCREVPFHGSFARNPPQFRGSFREYWIFLIRRFNFTTEYTEFSELWVMSSEFWVLRWHADDADDTDSFLLFSPQSTQSSTEYYLCGVTEALPLRKRTKPLENGLNVHSCWERGA